MTAEQKQKSAYERLKEFEAKGAHMLIPSAISVGDIAQGFALIVEPVLLKAHPKDKDVYAHDSAQYDYKLGDWKPDAKTGNELVRLHKQGFDRLAQAAKIDWLPAQVVRDPNVPGRMMASVEGMIRTSTGELYRVQDIAGMDLDIEMEKIIANYSYNGKFDDKKQWLVDRDFLQKKANQAKLCISGAKNRVIKQLLCLRNTYTVAELAKEFVAVRIVPRLDMNDEYTRRRVVDVQIAAMAGIYGLIPNAAPQQQIEMSGAVPDSAMQDDDNVIEAETGGNGKTYTMDKGETMATASDDYPPFALEATDTPNSLRADFENSDEAGQVKALAILAGNEKFNTGAWLKGFKKQPATLENIGPVQRLRLYDFLMQPKEGGKG
jgi:hypothetical protein